jgi:transposase
VEQLAMKTPMPPIHETPEELKALLTAESDAQKYQRLQALYLLQTQQARTRRQVAHLLGVHRETVGRWLAAYATGGLPQMLTIAKAPGKVPLLSPAMQQALRDCLSQPHGFASYKAIWQWLQHEYGLSIAYNTVHKFVRYTLRAKLKVPRKSHIKKP